MNTHSESTPHWQAEVLAIYISCGHDFKGRHGMERLHHAMKYLDYAECTAGKGIVGDRYFNFKDNFKGQITFFDADVLDQMAVEFPIKQNLFPLTRRNVVVRGIRLEEWIGKSFFLQGVLFEATEECKPCYWMDQAITGGAEDWLKLKCRGGIRAKILTSGLLNVSKKP